MRSSLRDARLVAVRLLWRLVFRLVRPRPSVVVYGWPDTEENALRFAVHAARHGSRPVHLLVQDPCRAHEYVRVMTRVMTGRDDVGVDLVRQRSVAALWRFARAEVVASTHGLFASPPSGRRRVHMNLWHGHGPKRLAGSTRDLRRASDLLVVNTRVWGAANARVLATPTIELLATGNPRQDAFDELVSAEFLDRLGLDPPAPLVVWLPTYRSTVKYHGVAWNDGEVLTEAPRARDLVDHLRASADRAGVQLIVKAHPIDRESFARTGLRVLSTDEIFAAGGTLYGLLAATSGLVSDYSSVWVEYLELDRPVGLLCPDLDEYERRRGFKEPTLREVAADLLLRDASDIDAFLAEVAYPDAGGGGSAARAACREALGVVRCSRRTAAVMARVEALLATDERPGSHPAAQARAAHDRERARSAPTS